MFRSSAIIRWRRYNERYKLIGNKCKKCYKTFFPPKKLCICGSKEFEDFQFKGKGKILSFTEVMAAPEKFASRAPYCVGIIQLEEGPKILTQITDCKLEDLKIGMSVEATFRKFYESGKTGVIHYGTKFAPVF